MPNYYLSVLYKHIIQVENKNVGLKVGGGGGGGGTNIPLPPNQKSGGGGHIPPIVGVDYTYIDVNALAQGIKSFLASHVWFQAVAGARTYGTDSPALTSQPR